MIFEDRTEAGKLLAEKLLQYHDKDAVVLALPRGGIPVGYEIAEALGVPLFSFPVRKIGAPFNPEYAIGALASEGVLIIDEESVEKYKIPKDQIDLVVQTEKKELARREQVYGSYDNIHTKIVILTDDGLATGLTAQAAIAAIKKEKPKKIILAIPCSPFETGEKCKKLVDEFVCLQIGSDFSAVGAQYRYFPQVKDEEVIELLTKFKNQTNNPRP